MARSRLLMTVALIALLVLACGGDAEDAASEQECSQETVETEAGLRYQDLECGDGAVPERGDLVTVKYVGELENGDEFDSGTFPFTLGSGRVIEGWELGIAGMREGGRRKLIIPPELGYGEGGYPPAIPPNATLVFDVELIEVEKES